MIKSNNPHLGGYQSCQFPVAEAFILVEGLHRGYRASNLEPELVHETIKALESMQPQAVVILV